MFQSLLKFARKLVMRLFNLKGKIHYFHLNKKITVCKWIEEETIYFQSYKPNDVDDSKVIFWIQRSVFFIWCTCSLKVCCMRWDESARGMRHEARKLCECLFKVRMSCYRRRDLVTVLFEIQFSRAAALASNTVYNMATCSTGCDTLLTYKVLFSTKLKSISCSK